MRTFLSKRCLFSVFIALALFSKANAVTTFDVTSYATLTSAISSSVNNDIINFKDHIVVTATIAVSKSLIFNGNGYTITVPVPGLNDVGIYNLLPSAFNVFALTGASIIVFNNLTIKGGSTSTFGAAVTIAAATTAKFNYCTISNSRCSTGGGGIYNQAGTCYLYKSLLTRNVGDYGGGMLNAGGKVFVEYSTINENRTLTVNGGGGIETKSNGSLYVNNSSFCNNQSGAGGAINNYGSKTIVTNSSFTGNIVFNTAPLRGGAIYQDQVGNAANTLTLVNCLFAYNYYAPTGGYAATSYTLDDIRGVSGNIYMYYCTYINNSASSGVFNYGAGTSAHALAANGSDNDIFTGGSLTTPFDGTGVIQGTGQVFQPLLVNVNNQRVPTLKTGSYAIAKGGIAGFINGSTPVIGYKNMSTLIWTDLAGTGASSYTITDDLTGLTRASTPAVGAIEKVVDNYIILKVINSTGGTVSGGSIYGEVYPSGTSVTMTALPAAGYALNNWTYNLGGSGTIAGNPLTLTPTTNTTLTPNFTSTTNYSVTYLGNGNTSGTPPAIASYASGVNATVAANSGGLAKTGFTFNGWNTSNYGSGTSYAVSATYTGNANVVMYASWISLGGILDIKLENFTANASNNGNTVLLKWQTSSENNNDYFEVERSANCDNNWESAGRVQGAGNSTVNLEYSLVDTHPYSGQSCYRLKQVDKDGKTEYFKVVKVQLDNQNRSSISIHPNPSKDIIIVKGQSIEQKSIRIYNQAGQDLTQQCKISLQNSREYTIVITNLLAGVYMIKTNTGSSQFIKTGN